MGHREPKKETKRQNKKSSRPEIIEPEEIKKSTSKGLIKDTQ
jgi:hypothetical protein